jgi:hypothetical protein
MKIFSQTNPGSFLLNTSTYTHVLLGMVVSGFCTTLKRFFLTVYFGRRQFNFFKPRLEKLLEDMVLVSDMASLAHYEASGTNSPQQPSLFPQDGGAIPSALLNATGIHGEAEERNLNDDGLEDEIISDDEDLLLGNDSQTTLGTEEFEARESQRNIAANDSMKSFRQFKNALDAWEEPAKDNNSAIKATIADVLQFKRALTYLDDENPFGENFGPSSNRDECIASSHNLYQRLCVRAKVHHSMPFSVLDSLYIDQDGNVDRRIRAKLKYIFPPNPSGTVDLFTFIQAVDSLYRRLRYLSASQKNDASLDTVLESIINGFYYFLLGMFLVAILKYNPWSMLVSITSLLVSLSFAFGPTVS